MFPSLIPSCLNAARVISARGAFVRLPHRLYVDVYNDVTMRSNAIVLLIVLLVSGGGYGLQDEL